MRNRLALFGLSILVLASIGVAGVYAQTANTCGINFVSGNSVNYGNLQSGATSAEQTIILKNPGTVAATVSVNGTNWVDSTNAAKINVGNTKYSMTSSQYATKTALSGALQNMGTLQPSVDTNTFWQLQANLLSASFVGDLTQAMNFRINCDGGSGGGSNTINYNFNTSSDANIWGLGTAQPRGAIKVSDPTLQNVQLTSFTAKMYKTGTVTGNIDVKIRKVSDDSVIATAINPKDSATLTTLTSGENVMFSFPANTVTPNESFRISMEYSGAGSVIPLGSTSNLSTNYDYSGYYQGSWSDYTNAEYYGILTYSTSSTPVSPVNYPDGLGTAADGSVFGGVTVGQTGKIGNAWSFDGTDDYVQINQDLLGTGNPSFTISFWANPTTAKNYNLWFNAGQYVAVPPKGFYLYTQADNSIMLSDVAQAVTSGGNVPVGTYSHIVVSHDGTTTKIFVNGNQVASRAWTWQIGSQGSVKLGTDVPNQASMRLNGKIDDLSIWSRALTTTEISSLYNSGNGALASSLANLSGLKAYYNFEQTGTALTNQAIPPVPISEQTSYVNTSTYGVALSGTGNSKAGIKVNPGSTLVGKTVNSVSFPILRSGAPTGTYYAEVYASDGSTLKYTFGSGDIASLSTSVTWQVFTNTASTYTIASGDKIVVRFSSGTHATNDLSLKYAESPTGSFDGTNTTFCYGNTCQNELTDADAAFKFWNFSNTPSNPPSVTPTFSDDFTSYTTQAAADSAWVSSSTTNFQVNMANDNLDVKTTAGVATIYHDLGAGAVSDTQWVMRNKLTLTSAGSTSLGLLWVALSDNTSNAQTAHSGLGYYIYDNDNNVYATADLANRPDQSTSNLALSPAISPGATTYYVEMVRLSATSFKVTFYSDPTYTTSLGAKTLTVNSGITNLRYIKLMSYTTGAMTGIVDDVQFWNGVTTVPSDGSNPPPQVPSINASNLVAYYTFEEDPISSLSNHCSQTTSTVCATTSGTPSGFVTGDKVTGKLSNAWNFDGTNNYVTLGSTIDDQAATNDEFAISYWVLDTTSPSSGNGEWVYSQYDSGSVRFDIETWNTPPLKIAWGVEYNTYDDYVPSNYLDGNWHHVVISYDMNKDKQQFSKMTYYDGVLVKSTDGTANGIPNYSSSAVLGQLVGNYYLSAKIDEMSIWARPLSQSDVTALWNNGVGVSLVSSGGSAVTPTFSDDYASYTTQASADSSWMTNDASQAMVDITNDNLKITYTSDTTVNSVAYDLGATSDTAWTLRFSAKLTSASQYPTFLFGLHSTPQTTTVGVGQSPGDSLNWMFQGFNGAAGDGNIIRAYDNNNNVVNSASWGTLSLNTNYYFQLTRLSATSFEGKVFTDPNYTTQTGSTMTITVPNTITGLRYLKGANYVDTAANPGTLNMVIDDIKFCNGSTNFSQCASPSVIYPDGFGSTADGTIQGTITQGVTGLFGKAALFNGDGRFMTGKPVLENVGTGDFTVSAWVKGMSTSTNTIVGSYLSGNWQFTVNPSGLYAWSSGSGNVGITGLSLNDNNWHHIVYSRSSGVFKVYTDGVLRSSGSWTGLDNNPTSIGADTGSYNGDSYPEGLVGHMDELSTWKRALTDAEISTLYNNGVGRMANSISNLSGMLTYFNFDETSGNLKNQAIP